MKNKINNILKKRPLILDGAIGTLLQKKGVSSRICIEKWCLDNPDIISQIHSDYSQAGADIIYTSTFGSNRIKLAQYGISDVISVNKKLAQLAKKSVSNGVMVAGDISSTGKLVKPFGAFEFEDAVNVFKEQVKGLLQGKVDLFVIETMMDIQEARAALLAVKELSDKFVIVTMTYDKNGRTLSGTDPVTALITLQSLGADAVGCNCSTGPRDMLKIISSLRPYSKVPLVAKPNAGLPSLVNGETVFNMNPSEFAFFSKKLVNSGASILGGCCGTTPLYIVQLRNAIIKLSPKRILKSLPCALSSARSNVVLNKKKTVLIVGERINPTGKKKMQQELLSGKLGLVRQFAREQENTGASLLDVNVGVAGIDEKEMMKSVILALSMNTDLPLVIDSSSAEVIENALRLYPGRALVNSVSGEKGKMKKLLPLIKKYGAMFILLPLTGKEIPLTFEKRKEIIKQIFNEARRIGFDKKNIIVDCLALAVSYHSHAAVLSLKTIEWCSKIFKANTIIGLSNISFGMPGRRMINAAFLRMAIEKGLTMAIADPMHKPLKSKIATEFLLDKDKGGLKLIKSYSKKPKDQVGKVTGYNPRQMVYESILNGDKENISFVVKNVLGLGIAPNVIIEDIMIPAIIKVGELFEERKYFLPQLIASAETMKKGVAVLRPYFKKGELQSKKKVSILMATVEGDIHDIGKKIVALMLENHGIKVIDLGKNISAKKIVREAKKYQPHIIGLSALMTTTMVNMEEVIKLVKKEGVRCKIMVGGAVLNERYAGSIGAEFAKDGVDAIRVVKRISKCNF
ncbi:MAG: homocysteine S-methyltransferase family protein [Candidatus Saelkia tenebricola]|nr:homocysteine S-methyltransferase family protein [Candidatus Saelkia tenebricola]